MNSLRQVRERKGVTLAQLSGKTGISLRTLGEYEQGQGDIPMAHLKALAKALYTTPDEVRRPPRPAPPESAPPPGVGASPPPAPTAAAAVLAEPPRAEPAAAPSPGTASVPPAAPPAHRPSPVGAGRAPAKPPKAPKVPRPPAPVTPGQLETLGRMAAALGLDDAALQAQVGKPPPELTHFEARKVVGELMGRAKELGVSMRPRGAKPQSIREQPDYEEEYLAAKRDQRAVLTFHLFDGRQFRGRILGFTPYQITIETTDAVDDGHAGAEVTLRKLAITYWQVEPAPAEPAPAEGGPL